MVPVLIILFPDFRTDTITAISMAAVACNAILGSVAYIYSKRVDYTAGIIFTLCTIPGSIIGVRMTKIIPRNIFDVIFGIALFFLSLTIFFLGGKKLPLPKPLKAHKGWIQKHHVDRGNEKYDYAYDIRKGSLLSVLIGFFSPLLGIGGGIIHVPAMVEWLRFPVHIATATSHFILAIMATISVAVFYYNGSYHNPLVTKIMMGLIIGLIPGSQLGAYLSGKMHGRIIIKALAVCLCIVSFRILASRFL